MPLKFVHLFVEMSQTIFKKPYKQLKISTQKINHLKPGKKAPQVGLYNTTIYIYLRLT